VWRLLLALVNSIVDVDADILPGACRRNHLKVFFEVVSVVLWKTDDDNGSPFSLQVLNTTLEHVQSLGGPAPSRAFSFDQIPIELGCERVYLSFGEDDENSRGVEPLLSHDELCKTHPVVKLMQGIALSCQPTTLIIFLPDLHEYILSLVDGFVLFKINLQ
jgi:hypothetical protein